MTVSAPSTSPGTATDPRLAESLAGLASTSRVRQLAPPFAGDEPGLLRRRFFPTTPPGTWTAVRVDLAGGIVSQLGSRPATGLNVPATQAGYELVQTVQPGFHVWTASLRVVSVSRLPAARAAVAGFLSAGGPANADFQPLVEGQTQLFVVAFSVPDETRVRLRCGVRLSILFDAGQTAYAEGIVQVQSIVHHVPPSPEDPERLAATGSSRTLLGDDDSEVVPAALGAGAEQDDLRVGGID